jgi:hypothetical protein
MNSQIKVLQALCCMQKTPDVMACNNAVKQWATLVYGLPGAVAENLARVYNNVLEENWQKKVDIQDLFNCNV